MNKQTIKNRRVKKNGKNKLRRKNKRKSTIRRKMKGGAVPPCDRTNQIKIHDIWNSIHRDDFEICGCAEQDTTGKYKLFFDARGPSKPPELRRYCQTKYNYGIVWHTHPACCQKPSKLYPSVEDLLKVIKHGTSTSLIFCQYGVWRIDCENKIEDKQLIETAKKIFTYYLEQTLLSSNNGHVIDITRLTFLIDNITQELRPYIPYYRINFNFWEGMVLENIQRFQEIDPNAHFY